MSSLFHSVEYAAVAPPLFTLYRWFDDAGLANELGALRPRLRGLPAATPGYSFVWRDGDLVWTDHQTHISYSLEPRHIILALQARNARQWAAGFCCKGNGSWIFPLFNSLFDGLHLREDQESLPTKKCGLCHRGPAEVINPKDDRISICRPCDGAWNRAWHAGELITIAEGFGGEHETWRILRATQDRNKNLRIEKVDRHGARVECESEPWRLRPLPTLKEWLGDHLAELGRWAGVLRDFPLPVGKLRWWSLDGEDRWSPNWGETGYAPIMLVHLAQGYHLRPNHDVLFGAFFTAHPDQAAEDARSKKFEISCEDQYEVLP